MSVGRLFIIPSGASQHRKDLRGGDEVRHGKGLGGEERRAWRNVNSGRSTVTPGANGVERAGAAGTCKRRCAGHACNKA